MNEFLNRVRDVHIPYEIKTNDVETVAIFKPTDPVPFVLTVTFKHADKRLHVKCESKSGDVTTEMLEAKVEEILQKLGGKNESLLQQKDGS